MIFTFFWVSSYLHRHWFSPKSGFKKRLSTQTVVFTLNLVSQKIIYTEHSSIHLLVLPNFSHSLICTTIFLLALIVPTNKLLLLFNNFPLYQMSIFLPVFTLFAIIILFIWSLLFPLFHFLHLS